MDKNFIRNQFNKQAEKFSNFSLTTNTKIFERMYNFCEFKSSDTLIDFASGSGNFAVYCSSRMKQVYGVDISDELNNIAINNSNQKNINNINFIHTDVESIPFDDESVTVVTCRSAFHHFESPEKVFQEMLRCLKINGKLCIQDMIAYELPAINQYFEEFEKLVDPSHNYTLSENDIIELYNKYNLIIKNKYTVELEHNISEYISHAEQTLSQSNDLESFIQHGLNNPALNNYLYCKNNEIYFKRKGIIIWAIRQ